MIDIIRLLPDAVANQIAAGEVIQRPASVVKELVENSVDAGATEIEIIIRDAGRTSIQVIDNGCGMTETDARMAFERHATSKITKADDLFSLHTMGFRGEALPSICAVSHVELRTGTEPQSIGTRLLISGSKVDLQQPCMCAKGTSIKVSDIFYNIPARRKFLKSDSVELANIMREFERLALVNHDLRMIIDTGTKRIDLRPDTFRKRIADIWRNNLNQQLIPVEVDTSLMRVSGYISRPEFARRRNPLQYLIVNGRNMRHPFFHRAIVSCYEHLIAPDTQPCYFLRFEVDPGSIDVNIHPTKNDIKFEHEQELRPILVAAVRSALGRYAAVPSIDFNSDVIPATGLPVGTAPCPTLDVQSDYNPFDMHESLSALPDMPSAPAGMGTAPTVSKGMSRGGLHGAAGMGRDWEKLYRDYMSAGSSAPASAGSAGVAMPDVPDSNNDSVLDIAGASAESQGGICLQVDGKYIVTSTRRGLMLIDQHRAHVKILYEKYMSRASSSGAQNVAQRVMFPDIVTLDPAHQAALEAVGDELCALGFILDYVDDNRWQITAVPSVHGAASGGCPSGSDARETVLRVLDSVCDDSASYGADASEAENMLSRVALLMARSGAIRRGRRLTAAEMEHLVGELFALPDPMYAPNGLKIAHLLSPQALADLLA